MMAIAKSESLNSIFIGGYMNGEKERLGTPADEEAPIIARIDVTTNNWVWRKSFYADNKMEAITSIAVNPQGTQLFAYASEFKFDEYDEHSYMWVIRATDGHYVTEVTKIKWAGKDKGENIADSNGLFFDQYGMVYIAL